MNLLGYMNWLSPAEFNNNNNNKSAQFWKPKFT